MDDDSFLSDTSYDSESDADSEHSTNNSLTSNDEEDENVVVVHGVRWTFNVQHPINIYRDAKYRLTLLNGLQCRTPLESFMIFFPIREIVRFTNMNLPADEKVITEREIVKVNLNEH